MLSFDEANALKRFANLYGRPMRASFVKLYLMLLADADDDGELAHPRRTLRQYAVMSGVDQKIRFEERFYYFVNFSVSHGLLAFSTTPFRALLLVNGKPWPTLKYGRLCPITTAEGSLTQAFHVLTREFVAPPDVEQLSRTLRAARITQAWTTFKTPKLEVITVPNENLTVGVRAITFTSAALPPFTGIDDGFARFWQNYGYKARKDAAMEVWRRLGLYRHADRIAQAAFEWTQADVVLPSPPDFLELGYWKSGPPEESRFSEREFRTDNDRQYWAMQQAARLLHEPVGDVRIVQHYLAYVLRTGRRISYDEFLREYRRDRRHMLRLLYGGAKKRRRPV